MPGREGRPSGVGLTVVPQLASAETMTGSSVSKARRRGAFISWALRLPEMSSWREVQLLSMSLVGSVRRLAMEAIS